MVNLLTSSLFLSQGVVASLSAHLRLQQNLDPLLEYTSSGNPSISIDSLTNNTQMTEGHHQSVDAGEVVIVIPLWKGQHAWSQDRCIREA